VKKQVDKNVC